MPRLPQQLCDTWAWIRWDHAGRPHRSEQQADAEYEQAVAELEELLAGGRCATVLLSFMHVLGLSKLPAKANLYAGWWEQHQH